MGAVVLILLYAATSLLLAGLCARAGRRASPLALGVLTLLPLAFTAGGLLKDRTLAPTETLTQLAPWADPDLVRHVRATASPPNPLLLDPLTQMAPWRRAARQDILFNPAASGGAALLGNGQSASFFPLELAGRLLPQVRAETYVQAGRLLVAAWGAFVLLRVLAAGELAALAAAATFLGGGFLQLWRPYPLAYVAALTPWLLLASLRLVRRPGPGSALALAVAGTLGVFAGHPETLLQSMVLCTLAWLPALVLAGRQRLPRIALWGGVAALLAALLAAPALLPFVDTLLVSYGWQDREHGRHQDAELPLPESLPRLAPALDLLAFGDPIAGTWRGPENLSEVGGGSLALAALALLPAALARPRRRRAALGWLLLGVVGLLVAAHLPLISRPFDWVPLLRESLLKRLCLWWVVAATVLVGLAVENLRRGHGRRTLLPAALVLAGLLRLVDVQLGSPHAPSYLLLQAGELAAVVLAAAWGLRRQGAMVLLLLVLLVPRVALFGRWIPRVPALSFYPETPALRFVQERAAGYRVAGMASALVPQSASFYGLEDVRGYDPMAFADYTRFTEVLGTRGSTWVVLAARSHPALDFLGVRFIFDHPTMYAYESPGALLVWEGEDALVYENPRAFQRLFVPRRVEVLADATTAVERARQIRDFAHLAIVSGAAAGTVGSPGLRPNGRAEVRDVEVRGRHLAARVDARQRALVASSQPAIPGWRARVDGRTVSVVRVNGAFLGVVVEPGEHRLELDFQPASWTWGVGLGCAGLLAAGALAARGRRR